MKAGRLSVQAQVKSHEIFFFILYVFFHICIQFNSISQPKELHGWDFKADSICQFVHNTFVQGDSVYLKLNMHGWGNDHLNAHTTCKCSLECPFIHCVKWIMNILMLIFVIISVSYTIYCRDQYFIISS